MLNLIAKDFKLMFSGHGGAKKKLLSMVTALLMAAFAVGVEWFLFSTILGKIQNFGGATVPFLTLFLSIISCLMIIMNTIRISVVNRRIEINIMKYVGATDWFIRWPFIIEGIIIGVVGALVPLIIGFPVYASVTSAIFSYLPMITFVQFRLTGDVFGFLIPFGIIFGIALGVIGSVTSIRKHLRV
jgi:cell division transport system permease protein